MEDFDLVDEEQMMKDIEKEMKENKKSDDCDEDTSLNEEQQQKIRDATHDKAMLADSDGQIHQVAIIDSILKDILKHQDKAFKLERCYEDKKESILVEEGKINDTLEIKDFMRGEDWALVYLNTEVVQNQRGVLLYLAKKIGVNLLTGKSIMNVSLPIKIFEPRSMLEKLANEFRFISHFLNKASETQDSIERMKIIVNWYMTSLQLEPQMLKPFNPVWGETFQGMVGEYEIILEQISHHPPIAAFQIWTDKRENAPYWDGYLELEANTGLSKITARKSGRINVYFPDTNGPISFYEFPECDLYGLMKGARTYDYNNVLKVADDWNDIYWEIIFNPDKKGWFKRMFASQKTRHDFIEGIITNSREFDYKSERMDDIEKMKKKHSIEVYAKLEGNWTETFSIDDEKVWEYSKSKPLKLDYINNPLPSDGRFRTDLIALLNNDFGRAQDEKDKIENIQRNDRKLRKQASKKK